MTDRRWRRSFSGFSILIGIPVNLALQPNCLKHGLPNVLERLDRIVRPIAVPNLTMFIIVGQVLMFLASLNDNTLPGRAMLVWDLVLAGEVWRLLTFFFVPFTSDPIFLIFAYLIF